MSADELIAHSTPVYRTGRFLWGVQLALWNRTRYEGRELLPRAGAAVLVANHQSTLDIPLLANLTSRHVAFLARESLARNAFVAWVMRHSGAVLVRQGAADRAALRGIEAHLAAGDLVAVFPEGTRSPDGRLSEFKGGVLVAARRTGAPLVPVGIRGALVAMPIGARVPRPAPITVRVGEAVDPRADGALELVRARVQALAGDGFDPRRPRPDHLRPCGAEDPSRNP